MSIAVEELRTLFLFESLTDEQLSWLAERGDTRAFDSGATVYREGDPGDALWVLLSGGVRLTRTLNGQEVVISETTSRGVYAGATRAYVEVPGEEQLYQNSLVTVTPSSFFRLPAGDFAALMHREFPMAVHLLDGLYVGVRNSEATYRQSEQLARLGTLSANLAHELNNPAAAAVRATGQLRERVAGMRHKLSMIAAGPIDRESIAELVRVQEEAVELAAKSRRRLTALEAADLEDALVDRLDELGVAGSIELAAVFVAAGLGVDWVDSVAAAQPGESLDGPLRWLAYSVETENLMDEIEDSTSRISTLVAAVKQYSYMDSSAHQEVDLHTGLDSTVVMLGHKLAGVEVRREYDLDLPRVPAYGAELNQVWTNLIDNAADAMSGTGLLVLRTSRDDDHVVVEVQDVGPGIPESVQPRVYDAFFTTKPIGQGSGLGLDNARRIVERRHGGTLDFTTASSGTTFRVRLPLRRTAG